MLSIIQKPLLLLPTMLICTCLSWVSESALRRLSFPPTSSRNQAFVIPDDGVMQSTSFAVNSGVSQIASTASDNHFVPLTYQRAPHTQTQSTSGPCQGAIPTDPSQKINRPEAVPMTSKPDIITTDQATLPQVPPTSSFIPEPQRNLFQAPRKSAIPPGGEPRRAEPNFVPMEGKPFPRPLHIKWSSSQLGPLISGASPPECKYKTTRCLVSDTSSIQH
jgi:hypothetical protein